MDFRELMTNTIAYPRIHFLYPSMVGFKDDNRTHFDRAYDITKKIIDPSSQLLNMHRLENKIAVALYYRGYDNPYEVAETIRALK